MDASSSQRTVPSKKAGRVSAQPTASFFEDPLRLKTILVPLDFSAESRRALDFALPLAQRFGARVHLLHAYEGTHQFSAITPSPLLWSEMEGKLHLANEVDVTFGFRPRREDCHLRLGKPAKEIVAAARELDADLVVIAAHGRSGFRHLALGSTTDKIIRAAHCPVLVVRETTRGPIKAEAEGIVLQRILVPVDFSGCAQEGARYASVFATGVGADLVFLHVVHLPDYMKVGGIATRTYRPQLLENAILEADEKLDVLVNFLPLVNISAEVEVQVGVPVDKLIAASARPEIDLVITSTHGGGGLRHALLGSVAEQLARRASCPVLIVPSHRRPGKMREDEG